MKITLGPPQNKRKHYKQLRIEDLPLFSTKKKNKKKPKCDESFFSGAIVSGAHGKNQNKRQNQSSYAPDPDLIPIISKQFEENAPNIHEPKISGSGWKTKKRATTNNNNDEKLDLSDLMEKNKKLSLFQEDNSCFHKLLLSREPATQFSVFGKEKYQLHDEQTESSQNINIFHGNFVREEKPSRFFNEILQYQIPEFHQENEVIEQPKENNFNFNSEVLRMRENQNQFAAIELPKQNIEFEKFDYPPFEMSEIPEVNNENNDNYNDNFVFNENVNCSIQNQQKNCSQEPLSEENNENSQPLCFEKHAFSFK